ncbi:hypothetical protein [Streptomyces ipomoeae]|uniref:hypothetical protein n=1 Tax=Streptomyces ipomoeae TaxID=103232 RepID=UPI0011474250|nr:hypothetical protein [Streptomyces ipomoeae]TQE33069.1 hypothetical protein Sipo7851_21440 [Streptomyces ipomoeae]
MVAWNLSVSLTGNSDGLVRTLRRSTSQARDLSRELAAARRNLDALGSGDLGALARQVRDASGDVRALRQDLSLLRREAGRDIQVGLRVDAATLRADVQAAVGAAGAGQGLNVNLRLADAQQLRRDVQNAVRWAAWGHRITIPIGLADPMQLRRDVSAAVRWAQADQAITVRVRTDSGALGELTRTLRGAGGAGGRLGGGLKGLLLLAPSVIPLATALAPLPGLLAASGAAATAFGVAVAGQIGPLSEVAKAEEKYQEAVRQHGATSQKAAEAQAEYQSRLAELPPEAQRAAIALSNLKDSYRQWSDSLSGSTMQPLTHSLALMDALLPHLTPEVRSASRELDRLITVAGGAVNTPGFDAASERFATFTDQTLDRMGDRLVHVLRLMSEGEVDGPLADVMDYIRDNGDEARETLSNLGDAVGNLFEGAAEAGPTMLTLVNAVAQLVAALPPELIGTIIQIAAALKLVQLAGAGIAAMAGGIATVQTRLAALHATAVAAGGGLAGLRAAFLSLGVAARASVIVAGIALVGVAINELMDLGEKAPPDVDRLTTSLGNLGRTGKATGYLAQQFGADFGKLNDQIKKVTDPSVVESFNNWGADITGGLLEAGEATEEFTKNADAIDESLTNLVRNGNAKLAKAALADMMKGLDPEQAKKLRGELDGYDQALADLAFEQKLAAESQGVFGKAAQNTKAKLDAQKASADGLRQSIVALNDVNRAAGSAMSAFEQSLDDVTKATKEHDDSLRMRNGELDLGSQKARDAEKVLSDLAANTDAAATAAREQGRSWEDVSGIYDKGRKAFIDAADAMGLSRTQAEALADSYLKIPDKKSTLVEMRTEDALAGLNSVIAQINKTPNAKSVKVDALTSDAVTLLESLGFKVTRLPNGRFEVTAETGRAKDNLDDLKATRDSLKNKTITLNANSIGAIQGLDSVIAKIRATPGAKSVTVKTLSKTAMDALNKVGFTTRTLPDGSVQVTAKTGTALSNIGAVQSARDALSDKSITITTKHVSIFSSIAEGPAASAADALRKQAENLRKADGGIVDFYADGGVRKENHVAQIARGGTWRVWAEDETHGEGYVPFARSKRPRSRRVTEEIVRRLGGDPTGIVWNADGGVTGWRYDPTSGSLYSPSEAGQAGHKTRKVRVKGKIKEVEFFDVKAVEKKLLSAAKATRAWNKDLERVAERAGGDVAEALASMGEDGMKIAHKMATGSTAYINKMSKALRDLQATAKATLTDYTRELNKANQLDATFAKNLSILAAQGYGDLAKQLAAQNDEAAQQLAAAAVKDKKKAAKANSAAKTANAALSADQVEQLVQIISAITNSKTGIHQVAEKTGLSEDDIIDIANAAKSQIKSSLGSRAERFLSDLDKANKGLAFADGGIREGIYSTSAGLVRFAEASTGGEAYIPLGLGKRDRATAVLDDVAGRFGYTLTGAQDAQAGRVRVVIIRQPAALIGSMPVTVSSPGATPEQFGAEVMRRLRNAQRGGRA